MIKQLVTVTVYHNANDGIVRFIYSSSVINNELPRRCRAARYTTEDKEPPATVQLHAGLRPWLRVNKTLINNQAKHATFTWR